MIALGFVDATECACGVERDYLLGQQLGRSMPFVDATVMSAEGIELGLKLGLYCEDCAFRVIEMGKRHEQGRR